MTFETVWPDHWLPRAPLAGESKGGAYRRTSRERALTLPYVEANPSVLRSLVVTDHDGADADVMAALAGLPTPSYVAMNPHTRAGHIVYALDSPVCLTDAARRRPVNLLARIEHGLCTVLGGDVHYGGRITKNPHHAQQHLTLWGPQEAVYGLRDLAGALAGLGALPSAGDPRRNVTSSAVGRNVALFDHTRRWSYRRRGDFTSREEWGRAVFAAAWEHNETVIGDAFTRGPLSAAEVGHVSRSIAEWTWRRIRRTFSEEQARRGRSGGKLTAARGGRERLIEMNKARAVDRAALLEVAGGS
ncbi:replication initiation protein [Kineococcus glutinatus]|uniref:Primase-like protein n=1 Tax=Kineococcus glutinatus TaxID=1070872 RepID=A0ABP9HIV9_9ACTN